MECTVASGNGVAIPFTVFYMPMPVPEEDEPVNVGIMVGAGGPDNCFSKVRIDARSDVQELGWQHDFCSCKPWRCFADSCHHCLLLVLGGCSLEQRAEGSGQGAKESN